jgi:hypothetical protein
MGVELPILPRFERKAFPEPMSGCWLWEGHLNAKTGYGRMYGNIRGATAHWSAHRAAYLLYKGDIPDGMQVCHRCDNRACVNPDHLFLGTATDNMQDASKKGRLDWKGMRPVPDQKGEKHPMAKLTREAVEYIRSSDESQNQLAKRFGVKQASIWRVIHRKTWL